jgi:hypothetical protein
VWRIVHGVSSAGLVSTVMSGGGGLACS